MKKFLKLLVVAIVLFLGLGGAFVTGIYLGYENRPAVEKITNLIGKEPPTEQTVSDFSPFWTAWEIVGEKYVAVSSTTASTTALIPVTDEEKIYGAISGLVASLGDPYSIFLPPVEKKIFDDDISGAFGGIGIEIDLRDGILTVISPLEGTPAKKAGVLPGDRIIKVDDHSTEKLSLQESIKLIRGEVGTELTLTVLREESREPIRLAMKRDNIEVPTIKTKKLDREGVFIISLYNFGATSPQLFRNALKEFGDSGLEKLVLDLRGNPGGYLEAAVEMASWFLPKDKIIVTEDHGPNGKKREYKSHGYNVFGENIKLVILVDGGSASASEILAGALTEHKKGILVGQKTFGKGSVQELVPVTKETSIKITVARWLTPNGHSLSENGLVPEFLVAPDKNDKRGGKDTQMEKAVEVLLKMK